MSKDQAKAKAKNKSKKTKDKKVKPQGTRILGMSVGGFVTLIVLTIATVLFYVFEKQLFGEGSIFRTEISTNKFVNTVFSKIPALLRTIQIVGIAWWLSSGLRSILRVTLNRSSREQTIVKLLNNFLKYLIAIIAIFLVLGAWGVNATTLLASAGILSLVIGLGAQSLISDIIAGIFIVFEDEFRVGDIVIIDGWRGSVDEIGIRATKVIDWQGNVKIVNNSEISTIINQSKELSVTTCTVAIAYDESLAKVELLLRDNLAKIREAIPEIVEGPFYKGVDSLGDSSVNLLFVATVKEEDYYVVRRALNREIKLLFDANNVTIPFPQVTVSYLDQTDKAPKGKDAAKTAAKADAFSKAQRSVSKSMEDSNE
ncbi:MAG: mechanosensitive ion channel family protein [Clostridia bacterium]|nr:mechanosensitive ion channel family protein [Clostridia bacterium]